MTSMSLKIRVMHDNVGVWEVVRQTTIEYVTVLQEGRRDYSDGDLAERRRSFPGCRSLTSFMGSMGVTCYSVNKDISR